MASTTMSRVGQEVSVEHQDWARRFFGSIDAMDSPGFAAFFQIDGSFKMGNAPANTGRAAIETFVAGFFAALKSLRHEHLGIWESGTTLFTEGNVFYTLHDERIVTFPYLGVIEFEGDLIRSYRAYIDPAPLVAAFQSQA